MHENKPFKSHEYAPIKYPHTYLLLVLEQNRKKNKTKPNETKQVKHNLNLPTTVLGISKAHDKLKIIIPTDFCHHYT